MTSGKSGGPSLTTSGRDLERLAAARIDLVLGCYPNVQVGDAKTYTAALVSALVRYSADVVMAVTDPATGIVSKSKWPPTVAELVEACEAIVVPQRERSAADWKRDRAIAETLARRSDYAFALPGEGPKRIAGPLWWQVEQGELRIKLFDMMRRVAALRAEGKRDEAQVLADEYNELRPQLDKPPDGGLGEEGEYRAYRAGERGRGSKEQRTRHIGEVLREVGFTSIAKKFEQEKS